MNAGVMQRKGMEALAAILRGIASPAGSSIAFDVVREAAIRAGDALEELLEMTRWRKTEEEPPPKTGEAILAKFGGTPAVVVWYSWSVGGENIPRADGGDDGSPEDYWDSGWCLLGDRDVGFDGEPAHWLPIPKEETPHD